MMQTWKIMVWRPVALMVLTAASLAGCASRNWQPDSKALGNPEVQEIESKYILEADVEEFGGNVTIAGSAFETPQSIVTQTYRHFEAGTYDAKDAHRKGNIWLGSAAGVFAFMLVGFLKDDETGQALWWRDTGTGLGVSLGVAAPFALVGVGQHLAPVLPPARRHRRKIPSEREVSGSPAPAVGLVVQPSGGLASTTVDEDAGFTVEAIMDPLLDVTDLDLILDGRRVAGVRVDLRSTATWKEQRRGEMRRLVADGRLSEARTRVEALRPLEPTIEAVYCNAVGSVVTNENRSELAAAFGGDPAEPACLAVWRGMTKVWLDAGLPYAVAGDLEGFYEATAGAKSLPRDLPVRDVLGAHATPVRELGDCAAAVDEDDVMVAWDVLDDSEGRINGDWEWEQVRSCVEQVRAARRIDYEAAVAALAREERAREARCDGIQARRVAAARSMLTASYVSSFQRAMYRARDEMTRRGRALGIRYDADKQAEGECMGSALGDANTMFQSLYRMVKFGTEFDGDDTFDYPTVDAMSVARAEDEQCEDAVSRILGSTVTSPWKRYLAADEEADDLGCH